MPKMPKASLIQKGWCKNRQNSRKFINNHFKQRKDTQPLVSDQRSFTTRKASFTWMSLFVYKVVIESYNLLVCLYYFGFKVATRYQELFIFNLTDTEANPNVLNRKKWLL